MTDKQKIETLKKAFEDTVWMAIRYADGRRTYAPHMVRDAVNDFKKVFPEWNPKNDVTIKKPERHDNDVAFLESDYLYDLFINQKTNDNE